MISFTAGNYFMLLKSFPFVIIVVLHSMELELKLTSVERNVNH